MVRREDGMAAGDALVKGSNSASVTNRQPQHFQGLRNALQASFSLVQFAVGLIHVFTQGHGPRIS